MHFNKLLAAFCLGTVSLGSIASQGPTLNRHTGSFVSVGYGGAGVVFEKNGLRLNRGEEEGAVARGQRIAYGYWFSDHWGVEASYLRSATFTQQFTYGAFRGEVESYGISTLGRYQLGNRWSLIGRINVYSTEIKDKGSAHAGYVEYAVQFPRFVGRSVGLGVGVEGNYAFTENASAYALLETRGKAGDDTDVDYLGVGFRWSF